jgi:hypothetical protein
LRSGFEAFSLQFARYLELGFPRSHGHFAKPA